jgi:PAS domain S-box-containing protein
MERVAEKLSALQAENAELRVKLEEAEETLGAIRRGEVEALVIGDQIYMLESAETASNRFRGRVLEQVSDIVVALDNDRRLTYLNPAAEAKYGVRSNDLLGHELNKLFKIRWPNKKEELQSEKLLEENGFWHGEAVHIRNDGTEFYVDLTVSRLRNDDWSPAGMLAVIRDITARKQAEAELQKTHDELELRVLERTRELAEANAALRAQMDAREKIERQRTELLQRIVTAQEDERGRIARDIHDQLGQRITALRLQIASIGNHDGEATNQNGQLELLKRTALRLDSEVSFLAWELRPASLDDLGLPEAAKAFLDEWSHNYKISSDFNIRGFSKRRLANEAETQLYRIMQEALNNVAKHANASRVNVLLEWSKTEVRLIIEDNGKGFDVMKSTSKKTSGHGLGLLGMSERAALVGGRVEIESARGKGTTIFASVPPVAAKSNGAG